MKFLIERDPLLDALQRAQSVVEKRNTVQILANVLLVVKGGKLSFHATDLEVGVRITLPVQVIEEGRLTLSAKHFLDIVKELPSKPLEITRKENNWVEILCGRSKFNIVSLAADEYPPLPDFDEKVYLDASVDSLRTMIDQTSFAVSTDSTRYNLNGVYFEHLENNIMRMTATDGHRLSFIDQEVFSKIPEIKRGVIIPKKGLTELRKLLETHISTLGLCVERGYVFAKLDHTYLFVRLIDGEYPDYRQVIPKVTDRMMKVNHDEFASALKRVSLLAHEKSKAVKFSIQPGLLVITSSNPDMGEAREEMDAQYSGELIEVGFNAKYVLDCMSVIRGETLEFLFKDRLSPGILRGEGQQNYTYVIMPMRI